MSTDDFSPPSFSGTRRWRIAFHVAVSTLALLAVMAMVNYLGARHHARFHLASYNRIELSPQTVRVLESLTNQVRVTLFFDKQQEETLYTLASELLAEYSHVSPMVLVKTVDFTRNPGEAEQVLARHNLTGLKEKNFIIFECEGRTRTVYKNELSEYDMSGVLSGESQEIRLVGFRGEMVFSGAIFNVVYPQQFKVCFLEGHREHNPEDSNHPHGYGKFAAILKDELNVQWETLSLRGTNGIPADCKLLVVAGPLHPLLEPELVKIEAYLNQGGRMLALFNNMVRNTNHTGLETILLKWGVVVAENAVFDPQHSPTGDDLITARLNDQHPVVKPLAADRMGIRMVMPRAVVPVASAAASVDAPKAEVLVATGDKGFDASEIRDGVPYRNPYRDREGAFPLIVAVEQGSLKGVSTEHGSTRIIVAGESLFLDNQLIDTVPGNHYFAAAAVNWLLDRSPILLQGLGPRPVKDYRLVLTNSQRRQLQWILLAGLPGAVLLLGGLVWLRRRR